MFGNVGFASTVLTFYQSVHMTNEVSQLVIIACTRICWSCTGSDHDLAYCMTVTHFCWLFCQSFFTAELYDLPLLVLLCCPVFPFARLKIR